MTATIIGRDSDRITPPYPQPHDAPPEHLVVAIGMIAAALKARSIADIEWAGAYGGYYDGRVAVLVETGWAPSTGDVHDAISAVLGSYIGERPGDDLPLLGRALAASLGWTSRP